MLKVMLKLTFTPSKRPSLIQYKHIESVSFSGDVLNNKTIANVYFGECKIRWEPSKPCRKI